MFNLVLSTIFKLMFYTCIDTEMHHCSSFYRKRRTTRYMYVCMYVCMIKKSKLIQKVSVRLSKAENFKSP